MGFNLSGPFELECWAKGNGTHNAPLFPAGEISLPWLGKYRILDLFVFGNEGPLVKIIRATVVITRIIIRLMIIKKREYCIQVDEQFRTL